MEGSESTRIPVSVTQHHIRDSGDGRVGIASKAVFKLVGSDEIPNTVAASVYRAFLQTRGVDTAPEGESAEAIS